MIAAATRVGAVHLTIEHLNRSIRFYETHLGFTVHRAVGHTAALGAPDGDTLLVLHESPSATRAPGTTGLYHFAVLVPTRADLARALRRLVDANTRLQGVADHGVSEALYLADPDGNGIEIYRDRPRAEWPVVDGRLRMGVDPLDVDRLLAESDELHAHAPAGTVMGHVHLHVAQLEAARRFYVDALGFELMQRYGSGAIFVSAGGYHHHIGLNTWAGVGAPPPPEGAIGLQHFTIVLPDQPTLANVIARLAAAEIAFERADDGVLVRDPSSNAILLSA